MDASWSDDFHHSVRVSLTGLRESYLSSYSGSPQEIVSVMKRGYLYQGQYDVWQKRLRGTPVLDRAPASFVFYLQNHDQVSHIPTGKRLPALTTPGRDRAAAALQLLSPQTPLIFMGQEFGASTPFVFFVDHEPKLAPLVWKGRKEFFAQFKRFASPVAQRHVPDPSSLSAFQRCRLNFKERKTHAPIYRLYRDLLALRRHDAVLSDARCGADGRRSVRPRGVCPSARLRPRAMIACSLSILEARRILFPALNRCLRRRSVDAGRKSGRATSCVTAAPEERPGETICSGDCRRKAPFFTAPLKAEGGRRCRRGALGCRLFPRSAPNLPA